MESRNEGTSEGELLKWNYTADLDLLKDRFSRIALSDMGKARNLLMALLNLTENSTLQLESASLSEGLPKQGSNIDQTQGQNRTPLDIELILYKVLSYLPVKSLLNCRLVNQTWNSIAVSWIRQKSHVVRVLESYNYPRISADFEDCVLLPFSSLEIKLSDEKLEKVIPFFAQHGSSVQSLTLRDSVLNLDGRKALGTIFKCVPNLKTLQLHILGLSHGGYRYVPGTPLFEVDETIVLTQVEYLESSGIPLHKQFLDQLFALIPNLKTARLTVNRRQDVQLLAEAMQNLNLTVLRSPFYFLYNPHSGSGPFWKHIAGSQKQKLKELYFLELESRPSHDLELVKAQEELLRSQSESLEVLSLWNQTTNNNNSNRRATLQFPVMKNLRILEIRPNLNRIPLLVPIEPNQVPRLRSLRNVDPRAISLFLADSSFTNVQEVELDRYGLRTNCEGLSEMGSRFPNLKKLTHLWTAMNATDMGEIVSYLRDVEELELIVSDWGEHSEGKRVDFSAFISGITMEQKLTLSQLAKSVGIHAVLSWIDIPGPSLRDLKRLTKLKIRFSSKEPKIGFEIDELGVYLTLLRMSSRLNLTLTGHFSISSGLASTLTAHFKNVYFIPAEQ